MPASKSPTRLGRRIVPISKGHVRDRPARNQRSPAGRQRSVARPRRNRRRRTTSSVIRDKNSRYGTYVNGEQVTERAARRTATASGSAAAAAPRWCSCSPTAPPPIDKATTTAIGDLRQIAALLEGCARSAPAACSTTCWRWCSIRRSRSAAPSAASSCWRARPTSSSSRWRAARGRTTLPGGSFATSRKIPEEVFRTGEPRHRRRPARRRSRQRAHGHGRARHPQRPVRAAAAGALPRQAPRAVGEERRIGVLYLDSREKGLAAVELDARRARDARHRSRRRHRERAALPRDDGEGADGAGDADRGRDPAGAAARKPARAGAYLPRRRRVAAVPVDRRRLLRLRRPARTGRSASRSATSPARGRRRRC